MTKANLGPHLHQAHHPIREMDNFKKRKKEGNLGNSLVVQWLGLSASTAGAPGSIPGWGTKIPQAMQPKKERKKRNKVI